MEHPLLLHDMGVDKLGLGCLEITRDVEGALAALGVALARRALARTVVNDTSSRSHCCIRLVIKGGAGGAAAAATSVLQLVDLAGAENVRESRATAASLAEACAVNSSLAALGDCLAGVARGAAHIPFRSSRLTRVLEPSLRSGSRCLLLLTTSLASSHRENLASTLRFAQRVTGAAQERVSRAAAAQALAAALEGKWGELT